VVVHQAALVGLGTDLETCPSTSAANDLGTGGAARAMARQGVRRLVLA
jgi:dTDP-L-rhamnose 4-epimerase